MNIIFDKPFKDYSSMVALLQSRGLIIQDPDFAIQMMSNLSYYNLINKSKNSFLTCSGTDNYLPGTTFEQLYTLHSIDTSLENIVLKYILYAEGALKSNLSYRISQRYGVFTDLHDSNNQNPDDYLYRGNYSRRSPKRIGTLSDMKALMISPRSFQHQSSSLRHYLEHHNHVPAWILTTSLTLGSVILWYDILVPDDKRYVCNSIIKDSGPMLLEEKLAYFKTVYSLLREYRNLIAHGNKTLASVGTIQLANPQVVQLSNGLLTSEEYSSNASSRSGLHAVLVALFTLMNDRYTKASLVKDLNYVFSAYTGILIQGKTIPEIFGLPTDILSRFMDAIKIYRT